MICHRQFSRRVQPARGRVTDKDREHTVKPRLLIRNPMAGRGHAHKRWPAQQRALEAAGVEFEVAVTSRPWEASEIAERESPNYQCIVAVGGDGTVHEVMNGIVRAGGRARLGVLPFGTGNDFARLIEGRAGPLDVLHIVGGTRHRYAANGMDIGFGAHAARNLNRVPRFLTGFGAYLGAVVLTLVNYPRLELRISLDDDPPFDLTSAMTAVMNGTTFGGGFRVCPTARPDDGLLDLLLVGPVSRWQILQLVPKILRGTHGDDARLRLTRARRLRIEASQPLLVETDGELAFDDATTLDIALMPAALELCAM